MTYRLLVTCALVLVSLSTAGAHELSAEFSTRSATGDSCVSWFVAVGGVATHGPWSASARVEHERERYGDRFTDWEAEIRRAGDLTDVGLRVDDNYEAGYYAGETWARLSRAWRGANVSGGWKAAASRRWAGSISHYLSCAVRVDAGPLHASMEYDRGTSWQLRGAASAEWQLAPGVTLGPVATVRRYPGGSKWHVATRLEWRL